LVIELDYPRICAHLVVYIVVWLLIYAKNREAIEKHIRLTLFLGTLFAFVSLMLNGIIFPSLIPEIREIWLSAISWPVFVNYFLLAYTVKERKKEILYDLVSFLGEKEKYYREVIQSPHAEAFEKRNAKRMINCLKYLESDLRGISLID